MQPTIAIMMLNMLDFDGFNDRHMAIICTKGKAMMFEEMVEPTEDTLKLGDILVQIKT